MSTTYFTENLLELKGVIVKNIISTPFHTKIYIELPVKTHKCPHCHSSTSRIHDYRSQVIKDIPIYRKSTFLVYRKRRYFCPHCSHSFYEKNNFVAHYQHMSSRLRIWVLNLLRSTHSMKSIAKDTSLSQPTIARILSASFYSRPYHLPDVIALDEFKGDTSFGKYQCIFTDPFHRKVLDILPVRTQESLLTYFRKYPLSERKKVKYIVIDMFKPYYSVFSLLFPHAQIVIDRFHYVRQVFWALENVRKRVQKTLNKDERLYFKRSKKLLTISYNKLDDEAVDRLRKMFILRPELEAAHDLKESFYWFMDAKDRTQAGERLNQWLEMIEKSNLPEFKQCRTTFINWRVPILNSFTVPYTNAFTEGFNNKIKVIKRNAYGIRNFHKFRNRILLNA